MRSYDEAVGLLGGPYAFLSRLSSSDKAAATDISIGVGRPAAVLSGGRRIVFPAAVGGMIPTPGEIAQLVSVLCDRSVYKHQPRINNGYLTLRGGHRAGLCGGFTATPQGGLAMTDFSGLRIRIARPVPGAAAQFSSLLADADGQPRSILFAGPPGCGKTSILRDAAVYLADRLEKSVCVIDERGELAAVSCGTPTFLAGSQCAVLDGIGKAAGILMAIRNLRPQVVIADEIGGSDDAQALLEAADCGAALLTSAHCAAPERLTGRPPLEKLLSAGVFDAVVFVYGYDRCGYRFTCLSGRGVAEAAPLRKAVSA